MKAYRIHGWHSNARLEEVSVPEPGPGEVLIRIAGAGACHSDLHVMHEWSPDVVPQLAGWQFPFTLGHENGGWIEGGDVGAFDVGTAVVVAPTWNCGQCRSCRRGATNYCDNPDPRGSGGLGRDGGMAEYLVAPRHCLVPVPSLDPAAAAPFTDAGLTSYHAVKQCLPLLQPDTAAVVIGVGGLGHLAVEFLRELCGASIIAVDVDEAALDAVAERGASLCLPSDEHTAERIREATGGLGAMAVFDFVGIDVTLAAAAASLRRTGRLVIVGIGGGVLPLSYAGIAQGCSVMTTIGGSTADLAEVIALAEAGRVKPRVTKYPLEEADEVYRKLQNNEISGRAVLTP